MKKKSVEVLSYTAGIIDGEGHIAFQRVAGGFLTVRVSVTNTNEWLCQWLKMQYGGYVWKSKPHKENWKVPYRWRVQNKQALNFLRLIGSYLLMKRQQAELALQFLERNIGKRRKQSDKLIDEAERILMANFNKRGI